MENKNEVACWGLRFSPWLVYEKHKRNKKYKILLDNVQEDLLAYGEGNVFTMEAEDKSLFYLYLMFKNKTDQEDFYNKHKGELAYIDGHLTLIKEPAWIPSELLENDNGGIANA